MTMKYECGNETVINGIDLEYAQCSKCGNRHLEKE